MIESTRTLMKFSSYPVDPVLDFLRAAFPALEWVPANTSQKRPLTLTCDGDIQVIRRRRLRMQHSPKNRHLKLPLTSPPLGWMCTVDVPEPAATR